LPRPRISISSHDAVTSDDAAENTLPTLGLGDDGRLLKAFLGPGFRGLVVAGMGPAIRRRFTCRFWRNWPGCNLSALKARLLLAFLLRALPDRSAVREHFAELARH